MDSATRGRRLSKIAFATPAPLMLYNGRVYVSQLEAQGHAVMREAWRRHHVGDTIRISPVIETSSPPGSAWSAGEDLDGVKLVASIDANMSRREFWAGGVRQWVRDVSGALSACELLLASAVGDPWKPMPYLALRAARRHAMPSVVLYDSDRRAATMESTRGLSAVRKSVRLTARLQSLLDRGALKGSDLAVIKVGDALDTLGRRARVVLPELHTMYRKDQVIAAPREVLDGPNNPPRLVYAGRVLAMKQIDKAIRFCKNIGHNANLTVIGDGDDMERLKAMAASLNVVVTFVPNMEFGDEFLSYLASFDYQIFLSDFPETPRSIVDGFAAGLPAVVARTGYTQWLHDHSAPVVFVEDGWSWEQLREHRPRYSAQATEFARAHGIESWYEERVAAVSVLLHTRG